MDAFEKFWDDATRGKPSEAFPDREACFRAGMRAAAAVCRKRAVDRFDEHGTYEEDTNASYYPDSVSNECECRDEEDDACAIAILAEAEK